MAPQSPQDWLLTYILHSTALGLVAWASIKTWRQLAPAVRVVFIRAALFGPLITASIAVAASPGSWASFKATFGERAVLTLSGVDALEGSADALGLERATGQRAGEGWRGDPTRITRTPEPFAITPAATPLGVLLSAAAWSALLCSALGALRLLAAEMRARRVLVPRRPLQVELIQREARAFFARATVFECGGLTTPLAIGRSSIVVPTGTFQRLTNGEREALLAHECAHLERRDPLWLGLARIAAAFTLFQPLQHLLVRRLEEDTELAADTWAAERTRRPLELARCLEKVGGWIANSAPYSAPTASVAMARHRSQLVERVRRLCEHREDARAPRTALATTAAAVALIVVACAGPAVHERGVENARANDRGQRAAEFATAGPYEITPYSGEDAEAGERRFVLTLNQNGGLDRLPKDEIVDDSWVLSFLRTGMRRGKIEGLDFDVSLDRLVLEVTPTTPFDAVTQWLSRVASHGLSVWKTELKLTTGNEVLSVFLPRDLGPEVEEELEPEEVEQPSGVASEPNSRSIWQQRKEVKLERVENHLVYSMQAQTFGDPRALVRALLGTNEASFDGDWITLDARQGVMAGDVFPVIRELQHAGAKIMLVGAYTILSPKEHIYGRDR